MLSQPTAHARQNVTEIQHAVLLVEVRKAPDDDAQYDVIRI